MKRRVLLLGNIIGSYRSQYIIDYLSQRNYDFTFVYLSDQFLDSDGGMLQKFFSKVGGRVFGLIYLLFLPFATHVVMLPMNSKYDWILKLARVIGKKTIVDFYISQFVKNETNLKIDKIRGILSNNKKSLEYDYHMIENADELLFLNQSEAEFYMGKLDKLNSDINYRICPLVTPLRSKACLHGFKNKQGISNLCWWGKASQLHGIDTMLEAMCLLKERSFKFHLYLLEISRNRALSLEEKLQLLHLNDVASVRFDLSFSNGLEEFLLQRCDVALGSFGDTEMARTVLINKAVDSISMGIPMVTRETRAITEFGLDKGIIFVCEPDADAICNKILYLFEMGFHVENYQNKAVEVQKRMFSPQRFNSDLDLIFQ
jgi:glycosyltransferase involved in cell wall biosynthesis